jgi:hypothetical protein
VFPEYASDYKRKLQFVFRCPRQNCGSLFIVEYSAKDSSDLFTPSVFYPWLPDNAKIAEGVEGISPDFVKILNQSLAAESHNLDQIVGIGLRKALEFLVKDYCAYKVPGEASKVKTKFLGQCITEYVKDPNIERCAKRATWLGNDETHYTRVWTGHDIKDLKVLIQLTQNWISNELLTQKYLSEMPEPTKKPP